MPSTFFGLTIAGSGLSSYQTAINATANNISNVDTKGYTRQEAILNAAQSTRVWAKYGSMGTGVEVSKIEQLRNEYYDMKYWSNQGKLGEQSTKADYLSQIETYFQDDEKVTGFTTIFANMFNALDKLKTDAASLTTRNDYISSAQSVAEYFNSVNTELSNLQSEVNDVIGTNVDNINGIAQKIASLNKQINIIEQQNGSAAELRDARNLLIDELSAIVPIEVTEADVIDTHNPDYKTGATMYRVKINGYNLVDTFEYNQLVAVPRTSENKVNVNDIDGLYDVYWTENASSKAPSNMKLELNSKSVTGTLKALFDIRDGNNDTGFKGTVSAVTGSGNSYNVTIVNPSITDPTCMTMPENGTIKINNKEYYYEGYSITVDKDGVASYDFNVRREASGAPVTKAELEKSVTKPASIGESIDFMGIAYYEQQLNEFVRNFAKAYNDVVDNNNGVNINSEKANNFFTANDMMNGGEYSYEDYNKVTEKDGGKTYSSKYFYNYLTAANFTVCAEALNDSGSIATSSKDAFINGVDSYDIVEKLLTLKSDTRIFRNGVASDFLQCLLSDISVDTQKANIFTDNYENLQNSITNQRMSVSSVDNDEEGLNLIKYQNAYNLSSKVVSILQEMYNQLILNTGA